eukprot:14934231-Ditylum_brightwellii.AAC.1
MFNNLSQRQCRKVLQCIFPHLLTLFDSLHMTGNTVYICREDSALDSFLQKEGIVQGCHWSMVLSALLLGDVIDELKQALKICMLSHPLTPSADDGNTEPIAFVDNNIIAVPLMDVLWTFQKFAEIGDKYGYFPQKLKNKVLTNILGISILDFIYDQQVKT